MKALRHILLIIFALSTVFWNAYVFTKIFNWMISDPFSISGITIAHGLGFITLYRLITYDTRRERLLNQSLNDESYEEKWSRMLSSVLIIGVLLGISWIIKTYFL